MQNKLILTMMKRLSLKVCLFLALYAMNITETTFSQRCACEDIFIISNQNIKTTVTGSTGRTQTKINVAHKILGLT